MNKSKVYKVYYKDFFNFNYVDIAEKLTYN